MENSSVEAEKLRQLLKDAHLAGRNAGITNSDIETAWRAFSKETKAWTGSWLGDALAAIVTGGTTLLINGVSLLSSRSEDMEAVRKVFEKG
ncbi:MAG: hypothetical protein ACK4Q5_01165 [Saprospiraceae bacterium]